MRHPRSGRHFAQHHALESLEARALLAANPALASEIIWGGHIPSADAEFLEVTDTEDTSPVDEPYQFGHADGGPAPDLDLNDLGGVWGSVGDDDQHEPDSQSPIYTMTGNEVAPDAPPAPPARPSLNDNSPILYTPNVPQYIPGVTHVEINPVDDLPLEDFGPASPSASADLDLDTEASAPEAPSMIGDSTLASHAAANTTITWLDFSHSSADISGTIDLASNYVGVSSVRSAIK